MISSLNIQRPSYGHLEVPRNNSVENTSGTANIQDKKAHYSLAIYKQPEPEPNKDSLESSKLNLHSKEDSSISKLNTNVSPFQSPSQRAVADGENLKQKLVKISDIMNLISNDSNSHTSSKELQSNSESQKKQIVSADKTGSFNKSSNS